MATICDLNEACDQCELARDPDHRHSEPCHLSRDSDRKRPRYVQLAIHVDYHLWPKNAKKAGFVRISVTGRLSAPRRTKTWTWTGWTGWGGNGRRTSHKTMSAYCLLPVCHRRMLSLIGSSHPSIQCVTCVGRGHRRFRARLRLGTRQRGVRRETRP